MNYQVDIVIVGDSIEGNNILKKIADGKPAIKIAFISRDFRSTTTHDFLNVEYIKDEVVFTDYKNRLFGCYLKNGDRVYSTHLIVASGLKYAPLVLNNRPVPCVCNNTSDIPKSAKNQPAIVVGQTNDDVKFALSVAKKYKHIYLCTENLAIENITPTNAKKLAETKNILALPNTTLTKAILQDGLLSKVELSNYSTVTCSAIFIKTPAIPETDFVSDKLISKENGYLKTTNIGQSLLVPKCFAVGNCTHKSTKKMSQLIIEEVLKDF